jgi:hypothetical protein
MSLFHTWFRQVEQLLQEVSPEHVQQTHRMPSLAFLCVMRFHQMQQLGPRDNLLNLNEKQLTPNLPATLRKHRLARQTLLLHPQSHRS